MNIQVVTMTPEWAQGILKQNLHNRPIRKEMVQKYIHEIKNNRYQLTHQGIAISTEGILLDGQHRLLAIAQAGVSVPIVMATNCNPQTFTVLDTGTIRKSTDILAMENVSNRVVVSAAIRMYIMYYEHFDKIWQGRLRYPTNEDILAVYKSRANDFDYAVQKARCIRRSFKQFTSNSALAGFIMLALDKSYPKCRIELFIQKLSTGTNLEETCPILRLRTAVFNGLLKSKGSSTIQITLASLIKTFNYWNKGIAIKQFKLPSVPPMPSIDPHIFSEH